LVKAVPPSWCSYPKAYHSAGLRWGTVNSKFYEKRDNLGVLAAQELGVQVVLLGIPGTRSNQSFTLINECDEHLRFEKDFWAPYFSRPETALVASPDALPQLSIPAGGTEEDAARSIGVSYAQTWFDATGSATAALVLSRAPSLPKDVDGPLLRRAEAVLGSLREREGLRRTVRNAFLDCLLSLMEGDLASDLPNI
jgi:hypothetical protein